MQVSMQQAAAAVKDYLDKNGWNYQFDAERNVFSMGFKLNKTKLGSVDILIMVRAFSKEPGRCHRIMSYGRVNTKADEGCMAQVCEYLTRANYGLSLGNFELDHSDGEIRYKVAWNVVDGMVGEDALDDLVDLPIAMFNRYGDGLLMVAMGMMSPEDAINKAEGN